MENNGYSLANPKSFRHTQNSPRDGERDCGSYEITGQEEMESQTEDAAMLAGWRAKYENER